MRSAGQYAEIFVNEYSIQEGWANQRRRPCRLASPAGLEPATHSLEGCCSIQLSYGDEAGWKLVGARGFEPPTPCSQSRCATRLRYTPTRGGTLRRSEQTAAVRIPWRAGSGADSAARPALRRRRVGARRICAAAATAIHFCASALSMRNSNAAPCERSRSTRVLSSMIRAGRQLVGVLDLVDAVQVERRFQIGILVVERVVGEGEGDRDLLRAFDIVGAADQLRVARRFSMNAPTRSFCRSFMNTTTSTARTTTPTTVSVARSGTA